MSGPRAVALMTLALAVAGCSGDAAPAPWDAPPTLAVDLRVQVEPTEVGLLQPVTVTLDRYRQDGVEVSFAPAVDDEAWLEQQRVVEDERPLGDGRWQRTVLTLLPVDGPGELRVPEFRAEAVGADGEPVEVATTAAVVVLVTSALAPEHGEQIEAPGEPFPTPVAWWWWVAGAVVLAVIAAAIWLLRRRPQQPRQHLEVTVPAHVRALRELQRWRTAPRATAEEVEAFYVGVSQVLRVYLEERFGLHAPERTTEEFLRDLEGGDRLARQHRSELERFLSQCDMVKFARAVPSADEHDRTFALAEAFVESTRIDRAAPQPPQEVAS